MIRRWKRLSVISSAEKEFFGAEFLYCVAQFGGFSNFEFFGGFAHVGFQFADVGVWFLLGGEVGHAFGSIGEVGVVGAEDPGEAHLERADDGSAEACSWR